MRSGAFCVYCRGKLCFLRSVAVQPALSFGLYSSRKCPAREEKKTKCDGNNDGQNDDLRTAERRKNAFRDVANIENDISDQRRQKNLSCSSLFEE